MLTIAHPSNKLKAIKAKIAALDCNECGTPVDMVYAQELYAQEEKAVTAEFRSFDPNDLDAFERKQYDHLIKESSKKEVLQILINNTEGDYSQLSPKLQELAESIPNL